MVKVKAMNIFPIILISNYFQGVPSASMALTAVRIVRLTVWRKRATHRPESARVDANMDGKAISVIKVTSISDNYIAKLNKRS